jgi:hypothetical protein
MNYYSPLHLQQVSKIVDKTLCNLKGLQDFHRAFVPLAGFARARCPPEFAYLFRAFIAAHRAERYRGGYRSAGRPAIWLRPIPAGIDAIPKITYLQTPIAC